MSAYIQRLLARREVRAAYQANLPGINQALRPAAPFNPAAIQQKLIPFAEKSDPDALRALQNMGVDVSGIGVPKAVDFHRIAQQKNPLYRLTRHISDKGFLTEYQMLMGRMESAVKAGLKKIQEGSSPEETKKDYSAATEELEAIKGLINGFVSGWSADPINTLYHSGFLEVTLERQCKEDNKSPVAESEEPHRKELLADLRAYICGELPVFYRLYWHRKMEEILKKIQSADDVIATALSIVKEDIIGELSKILAEKKAIAEAQAVLDVRLPVFVQLRQEPVLEVASSPLAEVPTVEMELPEIVSSPVDLSKAVSAAGRADQIISRFITGEPIPNFRNCLIMLYSVRDGRRMVRPLVRELAKKRGSVDVQTRIIKMADEWAAGMEVSGTRRNAGTLEDFLSRTFPKPVARVVPPAKVDGPLQRIKTPLEKGAVSDQHIQRIRELLENKIYPRLHDTQKTGLRYAATALLQGHLPPEEVVGIFEEIGRLGEQLQEATNGSRRQAEIEFFGEIYETIGLAAVVEDELDKTKDPITEVNKQVGEVEFFLPVIEVKSGKIIVHPGIERKTEIIQADGWRGGSKTLIEEKSCMNFSWIAGNGSNEEERGRVFKLASQIAKYGKALRLKIIDNLELNINAPVVDYTALQSLIALIPEDCRKGVKVFQRAEPIPQRGGNGEKTSGRRLVYDGAEVESAKKATPAPEAKGSDLPEISRVFTYDVEPGELLNNLTIYCQILAKKMANREIGGATLNFQFEHISHKILRRMRRIFGRDRKKVKVFILTGKGEDMKRIPLGKPMRKKKRQEAESKISDTAVLSAEHLKTWEWMCKFWKDVKYSPSDNYGSVKFKLHPGDKNWIDFAGEMLSALNDCLDKINAKENLSEEDRGELRRIKKEINESRGQFIGKKTYLNISPLTAIVFPLCAKVMALAEKHK